MEGWCTYLVITAGATRTRWGREIEAEKGKALAEGMHSFGIQAIQVQGSQQLHLWAFITGLARLPEGLCQQICTCEVSLHDTQQDPQLRQAAFLRLKLPSCGAQGAAYTLQRLRLKRMAQLRHAQLTCSCARASHSTI